MRDQKQKGWTGETVAAAFLEQKGIRILLRNFRCRYGEIDLVGRDGRYLIIIEVKMRSGAGQGLPCEAVDWRKQKKICRTLDYLRGRYRLVEDVPIRFDVVEVDADLKCRWIRHAFEYQE